MHIPGWHIDNTKSWNQAQMLVHSQSPAENLSYTHVEKWNNTAYQHFLPELEIIKHLSNATLNVVSFFRRVLCFFLFPWCNLYSCGSWLLPFGWTWYRLGSVQMALYRVYFQCICISMEMSKPWRLAVAVYRIFTIVHIGKTTVQSKIWAVSEAGVISEGDVAGFYCISTYKGSFQLRWKDFLSIP